MKTLAPTLLLLGCALAAGQSPSGPFNSEQWPPTIDPNALVDFVSVDGSFSAPGVNWYDNGLVLLSGGDQATRSIQIGGHQAVETIDQYLNIADNAYTIWANQPVIDILMLVYGNSSLLASDGTPQDFNFLLGTLPGGTGGNLTNVVGGSLPIEAKNSQWNWVLFRVSNDIRPDGARYVGSVAANATGGTAFGGVNGGTIRVENVPGLAVRVVAFGPKGAFGEPDQINQFANALACDPEPETNLAWVDVNAQQTNHLIVLNNQDQTVTVQNQVGPPDDQRRAVRADGQYMNFGITDFYLGKPCNDPHSMKVVVEYYDDPGLSGAAFGPESYATDDAGGTDTFPQEDWAVLEGTGKWVRRAFIIPPADLVGVNTAPYTGGPRFAFDGGQVFVSKVELGIYRTGTNALAGLDPIPDGFVDPKICTDAYGNYAELDFDKNVQNGLAPGSSSEDQMMVVEEAGPATDRRMAVRPDGTPGIYLNFAITDEVFGPSTQDNAYLAICVTYYDDPALVGETFRPEAYRTVRNGQLASGFTPTSIAVSLEGSDTWRQAYFEIPDVNFSGVNQSPQAAARFVESARIYITRVRYAVIRPCGPMAGVNLLEDCQPVTAMLSIQLVDPQTVMLSWPTNLTGFALQKSTSLVTPDWAPLTNPPVVQADSNTVNETIAGQAFYRLAK